jgi:hypothetical protein
VVVDLAPAAASHGDVVEPHVVGGEEPARPESDRIAIRGGDAVVGAGAQSRGEEPGLDPLTDPVDEILGQGLEGHLPFELGNERAHEILLATSASGGFAIGTEARQEVSAD